MKTAQWRPSPLDISKHLLKNNVLIDLAADFRLQKPKSYLKWYKQKHRAISKIKNSIYALPELSSNKIKKFNIIDGLVIHRVGLLFPTDPIVLVATWSEHRDNAFNATRGIMESLKTQAPFWKKESTDNGFRWVKPTTKESTENINET